jgi:hypothetical protein
MRGDELMTGRHYEYLTNNYVQAMGMEPFLHQRPRPVTATFIAEDGCFPAVQMYAYDLVVVYNHTLYAREYDGLAWSRLP